MLIKALNRKTSFNADRICRRYNLKLEKFLNSTSTIISLFAKSNGNRYLKYRFAVADFQAAFPDLIYYHDGSFWLDNELKGLFRLWLERQLEYPVFCVNIDRELSIELIQLRDKIIYRDRHDGKILSNIIDNDPKQVITFLNEAKTVTALANYQRQTGVITLKNYTEGKYEIEQLAANFPDLVRLDRARRIWLDSFVVYVFSIHTNNWNLRQILDTLMAI